MTPIGPINVTPRQIRAGSVPVTTGLQRNVCLACGLALALSISLRAATENVTYNTAADVPISQNAYTATGNTINFTLNFAPPTGTSLTVIHLTGLGFIQGTFSNLPQAQLVALDYGAQRYYFFANYNGHAGRDLVLQWANQPSMTWGSNTNGQLGNDSTTQGNAPVAVNTRGALWGKIPSSASAGGNHSLGLCLDGTVVAWGSNTNGQLGNNSTTQSNVPVTVTIAGVPATRSVVAVAAGASHSLALCSDGTVVAWGLNTNGQLGNDSTPQSLVPVAVTTSSGALLGKTVVAIAAGGSHSLALCADGTVAAWGSNTDGQLGNSSNTPSTVPVAVTTLSGALSGKSVTAIAAGGSHSLAICADGTVAAWGSNTNGQLGNGNTTPSNVPVVAAITSVPATLTVFGIAAGGSHSLAVCSDWTVVAWGANTDGQLGNSSNTPSTVPVPVTTASGALAGKNVIHVSAGASHSLAYCMDGTLAAWGANASGQLGNNTSPTPSQVPVPVPVNTSGPSPGVFSAMVSGSSANHTLSLVSMPEMELTGYGIQKQIYYVQSSAAAPTLDPQMACMFGSFVQAGNMGSLLASSTLASPSGSTGTAVYMAGSNGLQLQASFPTQAALDAAYAAGTYDLTIQTSTPNTYTAQLTLGSGPYPDIPQITGVTNATWDNAALRVTDYTQPVTITWNNPGTALTYFQISNSNISSGGGGHATSFTIPGGSLQNNSSYQGSIQFNNGGIVASIPGLPTVWGNVAYQKQVQFTIVTGTKSQFSSPPMYLLLKNHGLLQTSNAAPVDAPSNLSYADPAPWALSVQSPVGGNMTGPSGLIPLPYHANDSDGDYRNLTNPVTTQAALDAAYPTGTYTFPDSVPVSLAAGSFPAATQIISVNGRTPVWNAQGQLALDPTLANTIAWSPVIVPDWDTKGHEGVMIENYNDSNFNTINEERGLLGASPDAITSLTIPQFAMTGARTYLGSISYVFAPTFGPVGAAYAVAGYQTETVFMMVALKPQTLTFGPIATQAYPGAPLVLGATVSSGLPVSYTVLSGPATVAGNTVTLTGTGTVTVQASQSGNGVYASAASVTQSFTVGPVTGLTNFRSNNSLAPDGSQDMLTPARDGVPNLLKFAFRMISNNPGSGQATALSVPNVQSVDVTTGKAGLPRLGLDVSGKLTVTYIRRKTTATPPPGIVYAVEFSNDLATGAWLVNANESVTDIETNFQRVTVTDSVVATKRFARVRVTEL